MIGVKDVCGGHMSSAGVTRVGWYHTEADSTDTVSRSEAAHLIRCVHSRIKKENSSALRIESF